MIIIKIKAILSHLIEEMRKSDEFLITEQEKLGQ